MYHFRSGGRRVKKLSFGNALFNIGSQDLCRNNKTVEGWGWRNQITVDHPIPRENLNKGILKRQQSTNSEIGTNALSEKVNKKGKKLRWADGKNVDCKLITASVALCKVKEIPLEIRERTGPELGTQVDKGSTIRAQNNQSTPNNSIPGSIISNPWLVHEPAFNCNQQGEAFIPNTCAIGSDYRNQYGTQKGTVMDTSRVCTRKEILDKIIRWMPQWLEEQKIQRDEPEVNKS